VLPITAATWYGAGAVFAPSIHWVHGQTALGFASFGLRAGTPLLTSLVGLVATCDDYTSSCGSRGTPIGLAIGTAGAAILDSLFLAPQGTKPRPSTEGDWYGWQTALVDVGGIALGLYGQFRPRGPEEASPGHPALNVGFGMAFTGALIAPIVHFANGNVGRGFIDFGARAGGALVGAGLGVASYCAATGGEDGCAGLGASFGLLGGSVAMAILDASVLARKRRPVGEGEGGMPLVPVIHTSDGTTWVAVAGIL
jgi:hypothetical protein